MDRFYIYSSRIQALDIGRWGIWDGDVPLMHYPCPAIANLLSSAKAIDGGSLFPLLGSLGWNKALIMSTQECFLASRLFLQPHLHTIRLNLAHAPQLYLEARDFLTFVQQQCPYLTTLAINGGPREQHAIEEITSTLPNFPKLQHLQLSRTSWGTPKLLSSLSNHPNITSLDFNTPTNATLPFETLQPGAFSRLLSLDVPASSLYLDLLEHPSFPRSSLREIRLMHVDPSQLDAIIQLIVYNSPRPLRKLELSLHEDFPGENINYSAIELLRDGEEMRIDTLLRAFNDARLKSFFTIHDFTNLHTLVILDYPDDPRKQGRLTLRSVEFCLLHFPLIQHLEISVDGHHFNPGSSDGSTHKDLPPHPIIKILLARSNIVNPREVASWFTPLLDRYDVVDGMLQDPEAHEWIEVMRFIDEARSLKRKTCKVELEGLIYLNL